MESAVQTGKADAGVNDNGLLNYFVSQNSRRRGGHRVPDR